MQSVDNFKKKQAKAVIKEIMNRIEMKLMAENINEKIKEIKDIINNSKHSVFWWSWCFDREWNT